MDLLPIDALPTHDPEPPSRPIARNHWDRRVRHSCAEENNCAYENRSNPKEQFPAIPRVSSHRRLLPRGSPSTHYIPLTEMGDLPFARVFPLMWRSKIRL